MDARLSPIAADNLDRLQRDAARSVFWEMEPSIRANVTGADAKFEKEAWIVSRLTDYGQCGYSIVFEGNRKASILYCRADDAPGAQTMPTFPVSLDAQLITSLFIDPGISGLGLESILLDSAVMDLTQRGYAAVEAFGLRDNIDLAEVAQETIDIVALRDEIGLLRCEQLEGAGFRVVREHPVIPRLRLELPPVHDLLSEQAMDMLLRSAEAEIAPVKVAG